MCLTSALCLIKSLNFIPIFCFDRRNNALCLSRPTWARYLPQFSVRFLLRCLGGFFSLPPRLLSFYKLSELSLIVALFTILLIFFIVLTERKFLAYAQRRMGPAFMGRNGAFQIGLDLVKLLTKEVFLIPRPTTALAPLFLALWFATQLTFSQNFIWGPAVFLFENVDSLILYHLVLILFGNIFFLLVGLLSQSRYAIIATVRSLVHTISLDVFVTLLYSLLIFSAQSANFHDFAFIQNLY